LYVPGSTGQLQEGRILSLKILLVQIVRELGAQLCSNILGFRSLLLDSYSNHWDIIYTLVPSSMFETLFLYPSWKKFPKCSLRTKSCLPG